MRALPAVLLLLCLLLPIPASAAAAPLVLDAAAASVPLDGRFATLEADGPVDEVARRGDFHPPDGRIVSGVQWVRFTVERAAGAPAEWMLAFGEPDIDDVRVYLPAAGGGFEERRLGRHLPSRELPLAARRHLTRLELPEGEPLTVFVRLASWHKIRFEQAGLWQPGALMRAEARESALHAFHFGILAVLVMVYGLFGAWLRDAPMLLYALYVATRTAGGVTHTGVVAVMFPGLGGEANYWLSGIGLVGGVAAFILMWDRILDLKGNWPRLHRAYLAAGLLVGLSTLLSASPLFGLAVLPARAAMLAAGLTSTVLAWRLARRHPGDVLMKFYLVAFVPVVASWAVELAALLSPAVPADLGRRLDISSTMAHIAILSVALGYRLARVQREWMGAEIALAGERVARGHLRTFVDMATHEFKTPLAIIDSAAQMLGMLVAPGREEVSRRIDNIRSAVRRLNDLIETFLAGERDMAARFQAASPAAIARQAAERNLGPGRAEAVVNLAPLPAAVPADADLLGIALDALIDNACRYGPAEGPVELTVYQDGGRITFLVEDRGPGVPPESAGQIFDKYFRCAPGGPPGTGIGLYLVRTIAGLHGGDVAYRPREGGGATFALSIPAA